MTAPKSEKWKKAEWMFEQLCIAGMMPMFGEPLAHEEHIEQLEEIVGVCDRFYPAVIELGLRRLTAEPDGAAERRLDDGVNLMFDLAESDHLVEEFDVLVENLERLRRYDLSHRYLKTMVSQDPTNAEYRDSLALALAFLGELDAALTEIAEAVELEAGNPYYRSNQGWIQLIAGNLEEARVALDLAACFNPDDEVIQGNLQVLEWLVENGGTFWDYLLRPADISAIEELADDEEWQEVDALCEAYNSGRLEAMAVEMLGGDEEQRRRLPDLLATLRLFFGFVRECRADTYYLNDDVITMTTAFRPLMHKFIFKHSDADRALIGEICGSVLEFFAFLTAHDLVSADEYRELQSEVQRLEPELLDKAERYGEVRHDRDIDEAEMERIRDELFDGDHFWPHL